MTEQVTVSKFVMMEEGFAVPSETGLAVSEQGCLAVAKRSEICVELYRNQVVHTGDTRFSANEIITEHLIRPYDVCFAPNNHLVITDNGDNSIKVYNLVGKPRLVRKFVCHQRNRNAVIEKMECNSELNIPDSSALPKILTPQSITAVPSPLCQLFVVFAPLNRIVVITMDWNTVEVIDFRQLSSSRDWASVQLRELKECNKVSIVHDHTGNHKVGGLNPLAITEAQFCAMFYHVSERKRDHISYKCLQRSMCRVGKMSRQTNPKVDYAPSVVVYVRLTDCSNRLIFHARYGNCFDGKRRNTIHAEYLMLMDDEFRQAVQLLCHGRGGTIDMFMNKQPCYRSTKHHDKRSNLKKKECAKDLVDFFALHCSSHNIKFTINLCQLYKVDMTPSPSLQSDIQNGQEGVRKMISAGIELKAMNERSWEQLAGYASVQLPEYKDSERQKLDQHIAEFLAGIKLGHKSKPRNPRRKTRGGFAKRENSSYRSLVALGTTKFTTPRNWYEQGTEQKNMADVEDEVEDDSESNQAETTGKRKRLFHKELRCMMFGFGDDQVPFTESVDLLEDLVVEYITEMTLKAMEVGKKGKVHVEDIVFLIRKDPKKYARVKDLLTMNEELKKARKAFDAESYGEMV